MSGRHDEMVRAALDALHAPPHGRSPEEYMRCALAAGLRACNPSDAAHDHWQTGSVEDAFKRTAAELEQS